MQMPTAEQSIHGFNLLGEQTLVLSHIPMFMPPHQYQVFVEVTLEGSEGIDPRWVYLEDQQNTRSTDYVLVSDPIILPTLALGAPSPLKSFTGHLYRGWPWDKKGNLNPEQLLVPSLTALITRAIFFQSILNPSPLPELTYIAFHTDEMDYIAHELRQNPKSEASNPPDFYQIISAKLELEAPSGDAFWIRFPEMANTVQNRLTSDCKVSGLDSGGQRVDLQTYSELIFDAGHLM